MAELTEEQKKKFSKTGKSNVRTAKAHERRVAKLLKEWTGKEFRRRRVEGRGDDVKVVEGVGDVIPVEGDTIFAIEAKKGQGFSLDGLMSSPKTAKFTEWWHQVTYDAIILSEKIEQIRYPLLFFKPHPNFDWIAFPQCLIETWYPVNKFDITTSPVPGTLPFPHILVNCYDRCGEIELDVSHSKKNPVMVSLALLEPCLCRWRDFAANIDPKTIFVQT